MMALGTFALSAAAQEPIIQTKYTADPAPMVYNDTIFLYTSHDEDDAQGYDFKMLDWQLYTSTDMVNWTDHGPVASLKDFVWRKRDNGAWAQQVVERDGKFYMYCPLHGNGIGVLVSDSPYGPFKDPIGKPIVWQQEHWEDIDPTVWIDDDGQAYMYWGNPNLYYVKLNKDMISYSGDIVKVGKLEHYQEGPWFYKRNGKYYLAYASTCCPEGIGYAMSDSPTGPWEVKGYIMAPTDRTRGNHPGIIDYKGKSYVFGQNYDLLRLEMEEHHERRSISAAEMHYNVDGTIQEVPYFKDTKLVQIENFKGELSPSIIEEEAPKEEKEYGIITVAAGDGLRKLFTEYRADVVVSGGQTMNPSTEDICSAIRQINAKHIYVLPNNSNIIMAANQAAAVTKDKDIIVLETKSIPQGLSACISFNPDAAVEENTEAMKEAVANVKTGQVTYAIKDTTFNDLAIHAGDYMGIFDKDIRLTDPDKVKAACALVDEMCDSNAEIVTLIRGEDATEEECQKVAEYITAHYDVDVDVEDGGQPVYCFIIGVE